MSTDQTDPIDKKRPIIAIVDDDPADVHALKHAFKNIGDDVVFIVAKSGMEFLEQLQELIVSEGCSLPDLIFLDINMPGMTGFETLTQLRKRNEAKTLPVIIYSTTNEKTDVERAYALGANSFVVKPSSLNGLHQLAERAAAFWFKSASLPTKPPIIN